MVDEEEEASGYASSAIISSVQAEFVSAKMPDDLRHCMKAQKQNSKAQQEALDNIHQILVQLLTNRDNDNTTVVITKTRRTTIMNLPRPIIQRRALHSMPK